MLGRIEDIAIERMMRYEEYHAHMEELLQKESEKRENVKAGASIMQRMEKEEGAEEEQLRSMGLEPREWVVITEPWCLDSARILPVIKRMVDANPYIGLRILLRDENPDLMDRHLTKGKRAIPKLLDTHPENGSVAAEWGPRPARLQERIEEWKEEEPDLDKKELQKRIQKWYAKDRGASVRRELLELLGVKS